MRKNLATIAVLGVTGAAAVAGGTVVLAQGGDQPTPRNASVVAAGTSTQKKARAGQPCSLGKFSKYKKFVRTEKAWPNQPGWRASGWGPHSTLQLSKQVQVANTVSGTFGVSVEGISATVGFNVTKTFSTTIAYTAELKKKAHYTLRAGTVHKVYVFNVYEKRGTTRFFTPTAVRCVWDQKPPHYVGTGTAKKFWTLDYRLTKGRKA
ncbi:hypothetical protein [Actinomadura decatromicini]|uniref:Uncharacterized protein n=1 Tax=Actinomadura decatromicini TaxID=2604572 RepID=A0A5D3F5R1_9ACTN|nr:hypothetical protein [Actinomadura decatromicini]TYK43248.1 hypothetical protein FXF68_39220 [Actinomadura decatromicini]